MQYFIQSKIFKFCVGMRRGRVWSWLGGSVSQSVRDNGNYYCNLPRNMERKVFQSIPQHTFLIPLY